MKRALVLALVACGGSKEQAPQEIAPSVDAVAPAPPVPALAFEIPPPADKVIGIGRGEAWTCVVRASGGVDCWGRMGIGRPEPAPRRIPGVTDAIAVANDASCVLRRTGEVACLARDRLELVAVPGLDHVTQISSGEGSCFLHDDGGVSCDVFGPRRVPELTDAIAVARGGMSLGCAVRRGGQVVCGSAPDRRRAEPWAPVAGLPPVRALAMAVHSTNNGACALLESGEARCFTITREDGPLRVDTDEVLADLDAAQLRNASAFALHDQRGYLEGHPFFVHAIVGGKVVRWNAAGMSVLPDLGDAVLLASGCAVRAQGSVVCWDSNAGGIAGQPTTEGRYRRPPAPVRGAANAVQLAMTDDDAWVRTHDGRVLRWGAHAEGWATEVTLPAGAGTVSALAIDERGDACVIAGGGAVWCWLAKTGAFTRQLEGGAIGIAGHQLGVIALRGDGSFAPLQLHDKTASDQTDVPALPAVPGAVGLWSRGYRQCVRFGDGAVACHSGGEWSKVPNLDGTTDLAARHRPCALRRGSVACWDYDYDKPLAKPAKGPAVTDAVAIAGGDDQLCTVRARGRVTCFHGYGGDAEDVIATGATDVEVAPRTPTGCAIMRDRTVTCWGTNTGGILGDGSVTYAARPLGVRL